MTRSTTLVNDEEELSISNSYFAYNVTINMANYTTERANYSASGSDGNSTALPIDMQFNDGHLLAILVYSFLMCISAVGNISVLTAILRLRCKQRRLNTVHLLLLHLTIADLLVTFVMMPMEIAWNATVSWQGGHILCRLLSFFRIFGLYLSGFVLICMSVDRYYAILYPLKSLPQESHHRAKLMLISAWITSVLCSSPQVLIFHVESHPQFSWYEQCITFNSFPTPGYELAYNFFGFGFLYGLPLVTIVFCYSRILWEIYRINMSYHQQRCNNDLQLRRSNMGSLGRAKLKTLKMTVLLIFTFLATWTPYQVMCIWYWLDEESASQVDQRVQKCLFLFACTNSCMNPLIYGFFHFHRRRGTRSSIAVVTNVNGNGADSSNNTLLQQP